MSSDKEQEAFAIIDPSDSYAMKARRNRSNSGCCKSCMKGLILFLALVLAILCAVAIVLVIMLYVRPIIETDFDMQKARIYDLEMLLNQTIRRADEAEEMRMQLNESLRMQLDESQAAAAMEISMLNDSLNNAMAEIVDLQASSAGGTVYINWGSNSCPSIDGTELVYSGYMAGNNFASQGGGSNFVCAPMDPDNTGISTDPNDGQDNLLSGIEYEDPIFNRVNEQAACAVCSVSGRSRVYMQPAKTSCPDGTWTREYLGYLASEASRNFRTDFVCINIVADTVPGLSGHQDSSDLWVAEPRCNSLLCPPYTGGEELGCAVCTK